MNQAEFVGVASEIYGSGDWQGHLRLLKAFEATLQGIPLSEAARSARTTSRRLKAIAESPDPLEAIFGLSPHQIDTKHRKRATGTLGQLLVGRAAETAFEDIYTSEMHTHELELRDLRESRSDTDYRLYNGKGRPVYRINIKFHGALFQRAKELVGLDPEDCFALATYKIHGALRKQEEEGLPYIFAVVGVRSLSGEKVGQQIPSRFIDALAFIYQSPTASGKRDFEDRIVEHLVHGDTPVFRSTYADIRAADWYVISARRADRLVHDMLYDRVFAMRVPRFAQQFRAAELDMHLSLSSDLVPLTQFLSTLREHGQAKVVTLIERGDF
jgi:hypothetical protein